MSHSIVSSNDISDNDNKHDRSESMAAQVISNTRQLFVLAIMGMTTGDYNRYHIEPTKNRMKRSESLSTGFNGNGLMSSHAYTISNQLCRRGLPTLPRSLAVSMLRPSWAPNQPAATWTEVASFFSFRRIPHIQTST